MSFLVKFCSKETDFPFLKNIFSKVLRSFKIQIYDGFLKVQFLNLKLKITKKLHVLIIIMAHFIISTFFGKKQTIKIFIDVWIENVFAFLFSRTKFESRPSGKFNGELLYILEKSVTYYRNREIICKIKSNKDVFWKLIKNIRSILNQIFCYVG